MNFNEKFNKRSSIQDSDITMPELAYLKSSFDELKNGNEMEEDFQWSLKNDIEIYGNEENDDDPQYVQFLKNLSVNGKSYKLAIYKNNELSHFIKYEEREEEDEELDGYDPLTFEFDNNGDKTDTGEIHELANGKKVDIPEDSRKNKNNKGEYLESGYQMVLNGYTHDTNGGYIIDDINVKYESKPTTSYDSDIQILENIKDPDEVERHQSLKEKLIPILRKPYSEKEYKQLLNDLEKKKPICRALPLRGRTISSALEKDGKSDLAYAPGSFRRRLAAAKRERQKPKILNLMRMYGFALQHPYDTFKPWFDEECLEVQPLQHTK